MGDMEVEEEDLPQRFVREMDNYRTQYLDLKYNFDFLLGYLRCKPAKFMPKTNRGSNPLMKKTSKSAKRILPYQLTCTESDTEGPREHDYCPHDPFFGFTSDNVKDSVQRHFVAEDAITMVATEMPDMEEETVKEPMVIRINLTTSELLRTYDSQTHYGYLLDPNFHVDDDSSTTDSIHHSQTGKRKKFVKKRARKETVGNTNEDSDLDNLYESAPNAIKPLKHFHSKLKKTSHLDSNLDDQSVSLEVTDTYVPDVPPSTTLEDGERCDPCSPPLQQDDVNDNESGHTILLDFSDTEGSIDSSYKPHRAPSRASSRRSRSSSVASRDSSIVSSRISGSESDADASVSFDPNCLITTTLDKESTDSELDEDPNNVFGVIKGVEEDMLWVWENSLCMSGCHRQISYTVHSGPEGAYSILLRNPKDVEDLGDSVVYFGNFTTVSKVNRKKRKSRKRRIQKLKGGNLSLMWSLMFGHPVRLVRSNSLKSAFSPARGFQYGGLFYVNTVLSDLLRDRSEEYTFVLLSESQKYISKGIPKLWEGSRTSFPLIFGHPKEDLTGTKEIEDSNAENIENTERKRHLRSRSRHSADLETRSLRSGKSINTSLWFSDAESLTSDVELAEESQSLKSLKSGKSGHAKESHSVKSYKSSKSELAEESHSVKSHKSRKSEYTSVKSQKLETVKSAKSTDCVTEKPLEKSIRMRSRTPLPFDVTPLREQSFETAELDGRIPYVKLQKLDFARHLNLSQTGLPSESPNAGGNPNKKALWQVKVETWNADFDESQPNPNPEK